MLILISIRSKQVQLANNAVSWIAGTGNGTSAIAAGPKLEAIFNFAIHCAVDGDGNFYITEANYAIRKISKEGMVSTIAKLSLMVSGLINSTKFIQNETMDLIKKFGILSTLPVVIFISYR